jgi:hypothetical protein
VQIDRHGQEMVAGAGTGTLDGLAKMVAATVPWAPPFCI